MPSDRDVIKFVKTALECSVYVSPKSPGLTHQELFEIGSRLDFQKGEISDALPAAAAQMHFGDSRLQPERNALWGDFHHVESPDYRNVAAFDFCCEQLVSLARSEGAARANIPRDVLVERGAATGLPRHDLEVAITILFLADRFAEASGVIRFVPGRERYPLAREQRAQAAAAFPHGRTLEKEMRAAVHPVVLDVIGRRTDGRHMVAEPLDAFAEELSVLGYAPFVLWWKQLVAELRRLDPTLNPVASTVLAAALVEGALTFVAKYARSAALNVFRSSDFDRDPRTWKIDDLVASAASGNDAAVLDASTRHRADSLIKARQRIHAGRMLSEYPGGPSDLRPEEARDAKATAEVVLRRVLDWLKKHQPATA